MADARVACGEKLSIKLNSKIKWPAAKIKENFYIILNRNFYIIFARKGTQYPKRL